MLFDSPSSNCFFSFFFFNDTATTEIYPLSLHDALPISLKPLSSTEPAHRVSGSAAAGARRRSLLVADCERSEEHTSELQSRQYLVCRLLLEKKKTNHQSHITSARANR